jgi:hypothetical protein
MNNIPPQKNPTAKIIAVAVAIVFGFFLLKPSAALVSALCDAGYCEPKSRLLTLVWLAAHATASAASGYAVWAYLRRRQSR